MKLEFVMRDMKKCLKEEIRLRQRLETEFRLLQTQMNVITIKTLQKKDRERIESC
jgi:hypothetical protein